MNDDDDDDDEEEEEKRTVVFTWENPEREGSRFCSCCRLDGVSNLGDQESVSSGSNVGWGDKLLRSTWANTL